ncbi:hypothetical protein GCM10020001_079830 [Nonomuraea salmonea]
MHDAEELVTMARWTREARPLLESRFPGVPWERLEVSQAHAATAIGLMGAVVAGAAAMGGAHGRAQPVLPGRARRVRGARDGASGAGGAVQGLHAGRGDRSPGGAPVRGVGLAAAQGRRGADDVEAERPPGAPPLVLAGVHALAHALTSRRRPSPQGRSPPGVIGLSCGSCAATGRPSPPSTAAQQS